MHTGLFKAEVIPVKCTESCVTRTVPLNRSVSLPGIHLKAVT